MQGDGPCAGERSGFGDESGLVARAPELDLVRVLVRLPLQHLPERDEDERAAARPEHPLQRRLGLRGPRELEPEQAV